MQEKDKINMYGNGNNNFMKSTMLDNIFKLLLLSIYLLCFDFVGVDYNIIFGSLWLVSLTYIYILLKDVTVTLLDVESVNLVISIMGSETTKLLNSEKIINEIDEAIELVGFSLGLDNLLREAI